MFFWFHKIPNKPKKNSKDAKFKPSIKLRFAFKASGVVLLTVGNKVRLLSKVEKNSTIKYRLLLVQM